MLYLRPAIRELGAWIAGERPVTGRALDLGRDENGCQEARPGRCSHGLSDRPWPCRMRPWPTASRLAAGTVSLRNRQVVPAERCPSASHSAGVRGTRPLLSPIIMMARSMVAIERPGVQRCFVLAEGRPGGDTVECTGGNAATGDTRQAPALCGSLAAVPRGSIARRPRRGLVNS